MPTLSKYDCKTLARYFLDENVFATTLVRILTAAYHSEWINWLPATIVLEIKDDFDIAELSPTIFDKICAAQRILISDGFWNRWNEYNLLSRILNNSPASFTMFIPATPYDLAWGTTEAWILYPPDESTDQAISMEVKRFTAVALKQFGVPRVPESLKCIIPYNDYRSLLESNESTDVTETMPELAMKDLPHDEDEAKQIDEFVLEKGQQLYQQLVQVEQILHHHKLRG